MSDNKVQKRYFFMAEINIFFHSLFLSKWEILTSKFLLFTFLTQNAAYIDEQRQRESHQPKIYSKNLIEEFVRKRKQTKQQKEQKFLKEFFNYPEKWLRIQHELPPSLRLIDSNELKMDFPTNSFG